MRSLYFLFSILLSTNLFSQSNINTIWADNDDDEGDPNASTSFATMAVSTGSGYFPGERSSWDEIGFQTSDFSFFK